MNCGCVLYFGGHIVRLVLYSKILKTSTTPIRLDARKKPHYWIKSNEKNLAKTREGVIQPWNVTNGYINKWKSSAINFNSNNFISLKFEDWLNNKVMRDEFIKKIINTGEIYDNKVKGTHSSFGNNTNTSNRFDMVEIPEETKELIRKDTELHYLIGALGYGYKEI